MSKAYILVFDRDAQIDYDVLLQGIKNEASITNWWHYIKSAYILISPLTGYQLGERIRQYLPDHLFLLTRVDLSDKGGWLTRDAWDWINRHKSS
jgi:hypothetical protein